MSLMRRNRYEPFVEFERIIEPLRMMIGAGLMPFDRDTIQNGEANLLTVDVTSDENNIIVRAPLPGFKPDDVDISVQGNVLTITAESRIEQEAKQENRHIQEIRYGKYMRSVVLPDEVVADDTDASLKDGILTVKLRKKQPSPMQKITVNAGNGNQK
jgi:HSP20 family protein